MRWLALAVSLGMATAADAAACDVPANLAGLRADTLRAVNAERRAAGLPALAADPRLTEAAQRHACDMAGRDRMTHTGADGSTFATRVRRAGYRFATANENVGMGYPTPRAMVGGWMASPGHRVNILSGATRDVGIGHALARDGTGYWAMVSGSGQ